MSLRESGVYPRVDIVGHEALRRSFDALSPSEAEKVIAPFIQRALDEAAAMRRTGDGDDEASAAGRAERFAALVRAPSLSQAHWEEFKPWLVTALEKSSSSGDQAQLYGLWNFLKAKVQQKAA